MPQHQQEVAAKLVIVGGGAAGMFAAADAARRREPAVGQEAVSSRSRMKRPVRSQLLPQRHGSALASLGLLASLRVASPLARRLWLNTACCLSAKGVAKTKQRFDRAVGPAVAPCAQMQPQPQRFFNELKSHPMATPRASLHRTSRVLRWRS